MITTAKISGEAGGFGTTKVLLGTLGVDGLELESSDRAADTATWFHPASSSTAPPARGEYVQIWDATTDTTRLFAGTVTQRLFGWGANKIEGWRMQVSGPLYHMGLETARTAATAGTRPVIDLPSQAVGTSIETLLTHAATIGIPIAAGSIAAGPTLGKVTLFQRTFLEALLDLLDWMPDAATRIDYAAAGDPQLVVVIRSAASTVSLAVGTDDITEIGLNPELDMVPGGVELHSSALGADGAVTHSAQTYGAGTARRQIVVVSAPEREPWPIVTASFEAMTPYAASTDPSVILTMALPGAQGFVDRWSAASQLVGVSAIAAPFSSAIKYVAGYSEGGGPSAYTITATSIPSGKSAVIFGLAGNTDPPDWLVKRFGLTRWWVNDLWGWDGNGTTSTPVFDEERRREIIEVIQPTLYFLAATSSGGYGDGVYRYMFLVRRQRSDALPIYLIDTASLPGTIQTGEARSSTSASQIQLATAASSTNDAYNGLVIFWTVNGTKHGAVITDYVGSTRLATIATQQSDKAPASGCTYEIPEPFGYDGAAYDWTVPPSGLAEAFYNSQTWTPWTGSVSLGSAAGAGPWIGKKLNITCGDPALASAGAFVLRERLSLPARTLQLTCGAPARQSLSSLVSRFRTMASDAYEIAD